MEAPPSPHGSAVSGLMQQLKSGEISKMQLFQQIAKLQAAAAVAASANANVSTQPSLPTGAAATAPGIGTPSVFATPAPQMTSTLRGTTTAPASIAPSSIFSSGHSATLGARSDAPQLHAAFASLPPPLLAPAAAASASSQQPPPPHFSIESSRGATPALAASQRTGGAPIVESDAEFLASGVSHDKAPRFSVQEWMATKNRAPSATHQPSHATTAALGDTAALRHMSFFPLSQPQQQISSAPVGGSYPASIGLGLPASGLASSASQLFTFPHQPQQQHVSTSDASAVAATLSRVERDGQYEYNPHRQFRDQQLQQHTLEHRDGHDSSQQQQPQQPHHQNSSSNSTPDASEQEYIDFTEHFRDEINHAGTGNDRSRSLNLTGKGAAGASGASNNNAASAGGDDAFHARVTRWKSQKDAIREQMKQQLLQSELDECTFAPKVNPKSTKVAAKLRSRQGSVKEVVSSPLAVSERLYQEADNYKAREELAQRVKAEEEADLERECTFKPKINRATALTEKVKAKYMETQKTPSPSLTAAAMESTAKELEQCTFYPKVNPISADMVSAQLYLQQDIYERLSRPCCMASDSPVKTQRARRRAGSLTDDDTSRETDSDLASSVASPRRSQDDCYIRSLSPRRRRTSLVTNGRSSSGKRQSQQRQRPRSAGGADDEKDERARQLSNFLERQHFHEEARRKKIETTKQQLQPAHKPTINKKSLDMMENGRKGDFLERITKYALRKEHDNVKKKSVRVSDPNCTFKPSINQTSTKRKGRSVTELSRGDLLRRETTQRLMKLKMEQEEMAALTFRPQLNRVSERHEGKLKILTSPETYLQRIQQQSQAHTIKQRRAVQEKEMEEFAECTFKPRTIEAPAYIQRIARSVSLTKALKQQQLSASRAADKPEWK